MATFPKPTVPELNEVLATRMRLASMTGKPSQTATARVVASGEGRAFELHTAECVGCPYCRPARGVQ